MSKCVSRIITNFKNTTFYIDVTRNLENRIFVHRKELLEGFSKRYKLTKLVYYEEFEHIESAILREKQLKNWHRNWKINLIKSINPEMKDLMENPF